MGTTTNQALPYPEPTDRARNGSVAIRALAEAVDAALDWAPGVTITEGESARTCGGAGSYVDFTGVVASMGDFTQVGDSYRYDGDAARMFLVSATVEVELGNGSGQPTMSSTVNVRVNNVDTRGSHDQVSSIEAGGTLRNRETVHAVNLPLVLSPGDLVAAYASGDPGVGGVAAIGSTSLRIYPMGPA